MDSIAHSPISLRITDTHERCALVFLFNNTRSNICQIQGAGNQVLRSRCYANGMLYFFHGSDTEKVRAKAFAWVAAAREKEPNLAYARLSKEEMSAAALEEAAYAGSLFASRTLTLLDDPFGKPRAPEGAEEAEVSESAASLAATEALAMLAASENVFVILAPKLDVRASGRIAALAKKTYVFDIPERKEAARGFNAGLVNALAQRNGERLWIEIVRALRAGDAPEAVHGLLHWKVRDLLEKGSHVWKPSETRALSLSLIALLQNSRRTSSDLAGALERFALAL